MLTTILMRDLYDTGAMNTGDYANDSFIGRTPRPTDQKIKDRIGHSTDDGDSLALTFAMPVPVANKQHTTDFRQSATTDVRDARRGGWMY